VSDFCPDGYLPTRDAIVRAAERWFPDKIAALETAAAPESQTKPDNNLDAAARAFSQPQVPDAWRHAFEEIASQTVHRLRNFLHQGTLKAYYFGDDGCHSVSRQFWATAKAHGVMESGTYWPFGEPTRWHDQRLHHPLFVKQSELDALLNEQHVEKPGLPGAKMRDLVVALRTLDHLPNRRKQREALRKLPEFERYHLTDDVFREVEKQVPRKRGRKPLRPEK
jgi:DNA polymerase III delta prime subunit